MTTKNILQVWNKRNAELYIAVEEKDMDSFLAYCKEMSWLFVESFSVPFTNEKAAEFYRSGSLVRHYTPAV